LDGKSLRQTKFGRVLLFELQIFNGFDKRVSFRVLRVCDGKGLFETRYGSRKPDLYGSQPLGAFDNVRSVFGPYILVLKARVLKKYRRGRASTGVGVGFKDIHDGGGTPHATYRGTWNAIASRETRTVKNNYHKWTEILSDFPSSDQSP
jgi:hypothetical protein